GLDSAQLAKRMGELFQATVTATEQAMRAGVEDIGAAITSIANDLGGGNIAAELKKIVQNRLPQRFKEAIDRAFGNVFDTAKPTEFFKNMDKLVGANSE